MAKHNTPLPLHKQRDIALFRAARSQARRLGVDPATLDGAAALRVLDDMARSEPALVASIWYRSASANQVRLFKREWRKGGDDGR